MSEEQLARYIELKNIIKDNNAEMKPLKKELKELEQEILNSGQKEYSYYGVKITVIQKETEKMNKEEVEALISKEIRSNGNDGLTYNDFYERSIKNVIKMGDVKLKGDTDE